MVSSVFKKKYLLFLIFSMLFLSSCASFEQQKQKDEKQEVAEKTYSRFEFALDTAIQIDIFSGGSERILDEAVDILKNFEHQMSYYSEDGELNKINSAPANQEVVLSDTMFEVLKIAQDVYRLSNSRFDISIGAVSKLWRDHINAKTLPEDSQISELMKHKGFDNIILMNHRLIKSNDRIKLDLGGIGKGFSADLVKRHLEKSGVTKAILNFGGNLVLMGSTPEDPYKIGIQDPFGDRNNYFAVLTVGDCAVVTSGSYERNFEIDGKLYHHIIDSETGYPVDNSLTSVTVITDSSAYADALSTAFFTMGLSEGMKLANSLENVSAYFVSKSKKVYCSKYSDKSIIITDKRYKLIRFDH